MFGFFDQIGNSINAVFDFIVSLFRNMISFFQIIITSLSFLVEISASLPVPIQAGCLAIIAVSVVYLIVGR